MNKTRIIGLILLGIGVVLFYIYNGDAIGMIAGLLCGIGIGLLLTGRVKLNSGN